jgi:hypothetical protein
MFRHHSILDMSPPVATVMMDLLRRKNISKVTRTYIIVSLESKNSRSMLMFAIKMFSQCSEMTFSILRFCVWKTFGLKIENPNKLKSTLNFPERNMKNV